MMISTNLQFIILLCLISHCLDAREQENFRESGQNDKQEVSAKDDDHASFAQQQEPVLSNDKKPLQGQVLPDKDQQVPKYEELPATGVHQEERSSQVQQPPVSQEPPTKGHQKDQEEEIKSPLPVPAPIQEPPVVQNELHQPDIRKKQQNHEEQMQPKVLDEKHLEKPLGADSPAHETSQARAAAEKEEPKEESVPSVPFDGPYDEEATRIYTEERVAKLQGEPSSMPGMKKPVIPPIFKESERPLQANDDTEDDEEELTPEEIEAEKLFQAGEKLINATYYKEYKEAYLNFLRASELNHPKAKEHVAFGHLFGDYLPQNVTRSYELFQELADKGSPKAQMGLAFMYSAGFFFNSSQAKALIYSTFGALGGEPLAQMALGYRYYGGIGVESKCETALTYYRKVATKVAETVTLAGGPVVQRVRLLEEAESQGSNNSPLLDFDLLQYYHFLADKGDQQAQVVLGTLYYQGGKGVQINHEQAYHYFSTSAESGSGHALGYLGKMHSEGSPVVKQSNHTAFEFFKKSADKNNHIGQAGLGLMYLNGLGVEKDTDKAFRYFSQASDQGSVDGQLQLGIMYFTGNGVRKDYKMAVKYFTMASQNGHVLAFFNLAQMHATGTGVLRNCHTAVELFKNVAERGRWSEMMMDAHRMYHEGNVDTALVKYMFLAELGYEVAQSNVAYLLDNGVTTKFTSYETHQRALLQYSRAASQGSTHARLRMGDYHYYGLGTNVDYESAASHYRMASEQQHNPQAMFNLGYMHELGLGLKQDVHLAKRFYDMAAETSLDAHVPVTLALLKLGIFYGVDVFSKEFEGVSGLMKLFDPVHHLGPEWDLYLAGFLAATLGMLFFLRRRRGR